MKSVGVRGNESTEYDIYFVRRMREQMSVVVGVLSKVHSERGSLGPPGEVSLVHLRVWRSISLGADCGAPC